jgi:hypothetical protein
MKKMDIGQLQPQQMMRPVMVTRFQGYEIDGNLGDDRAVKIHIENTGGILTVRLLQSTEDDHEMISLDFQAARTLAEILSDITSVSGANLTMPEQG